MPAPFLSVLIDDCVAKGMDYNAGGARYNNSYVQFVGLGSITDSLSALNQCCFQKGFLCLEPKPRPSRGVPAFDESKARVRTGAHPGRRLQRCRTSQAVALE